MQIASKTRPDLAQAPVDLRDKVGGLPPSMEKSTSPDRSLKGWRPMLPVEFAALRLSGWDIANRKDRRRGCAAEFGESRAIFVGSADLLSESQTPRATA
ncbi:hypothetical protein FXW78_33235 [Rhodococcus opacus]|nr:hypothetical protein [Rhodococcus opacus]